MHHSCMVTMTQALEWVGEKQANACVWMYVHDVMCVMYVCMWHVCMCVHVFGMYVCIYEQGVLLELWCGNIAELQSAP